MLDVEKVDFHPLGCRWIRDRSDCGNTNPGSW